MTEEDVAQRMGELEAEVSDLRRTQQRVLTVLTGMGAAALTAQQFDPRRLDT